MADADVPSHSRPPSGRSRRWKLPPHDDPTAESTIGAFTRSPVPGRGDTDDGNTLVDPVAGIATRLAWDQVLRCEQGRFARYGGPVTLLVAELNDVPGLFGMLGYDGADRLIRNIAATMRQGARSADFLARTGHLRLVALLPETDEVAAINYVERVRSACDVLLEANPVSFCLAIGWAQPVAGGSLADALDLADERMNADRRRLGSDGAPQGRSPALTTP